MHEEDLAELLRCKYTRYRPGTNADRYVRAQHARFPHADGYGSAVAIADYLVMDTYGAGEVLGFEIKVSRSDWLTELRNPQKAEFWKQHCNRWFLVTSDKHIVRDDLPTGWGHMSLTASGLRIVTQSPRNLAPTPFAPRTLVQLGRSIAQTREKELRHR